MFKTMLLITDVSIFVLAINAAATVQKMQSVPKKIIYANSIHRYCNNAFKQKAKAAVPLVAKRFWCCAGHRRQHQQYL